MSSRNNYSRKRSRSRSPDYRHRKGERRDHFEKPDYRRYDNKK